MYADLPNLIIRDSDCFKVTTTIETMPICRPILRTAYY